jgi:hypothetical protein
MFRIPLIALFICSIFTLSYAQDSIKKTTPVTPSVIKYKAHKYHYRYRKAGTDSAKVNPAAQPQTTVPVNPAPVKTDSAAPPVLVDKSLNGQYHYLLSKIYHYQQPLIGSLWKSVSDTLTADHRKLQALNSKLNIQNKTIDSLKAEVNNKDQTLTASNSKPNAVNFLGTTMEASTYSMIMWGLVLLFGITAGVVIVRSGSLSREAKYRTILYEELEDEIKVYKAKANEKEIKLARELQTERNKLDDLLGKG